MLNRNSEGELREQLTLAGARFKGKAIGCPFCADAHPSGNIYRAEDGVFRYKCHAKCQFVGDIYDVVAKMTGRPVEDLLKEDHPKAITRAPSTKPVTVYPTIEAIEAIVPGTIEARYTYTNPATRQPDLVVIRYRQDGKKHFWQCSPVDGGWVLKRPAGKLPLYNRIHVAKASTVLVGEGEKVVHAMRAAGHVGTTAPMGAGNGQYADWTPLAGKTCYLWPDNDEAGVKHMQEVSEILDKTEPTPTLYWIDPKGLNLKAKGDVVDFLAMFEPELAYSAIQTVMDLAEPIGAAKELKAMLEATISGQRACVALPWEKTSMLSKSLMPGAIALLCGDPGASKSFALLQIAYRWHQDGVKFALFELEEDRAYHLNRFLAQVTGVPGLIDTDWVKANPDAVRTMYAQHEKLLNDFGRRLYAAPDKQVDYTTLAQWVESRATEGCRAIAIDPVTAVSPDRDVFIADSKFLFTIKTVARSFGCTVLLVTHPRKGRGGSIGLDDLSGGSAYQRFSQTVLWLESMVKPKTATVQGECGRFDVDVNRMMHLCKCRNGRGTGLMVGMKWEASTLTLAEQGVFIGYKKAKKADDETGSP